MGRFPGEAAGYFLDDVLTFGAIHDVAELEEQLQIQEFEERPQTVTRRQCRPPGQADALAWPPASEHTTSAAAPCRTGGGHALLR